MATELPVHSQGFLTSFFHSKVIQVKGLISHFDLRFPKPLESAYHRTICSQNTQGAKVSICLMASLVLISALLDFLQVSEASNWSVRLPFFLIMVFSYVLSSVGFFKHLQGLMVYISITCLALYAMILGSNIPSDLAMVYGMSIAPLAVMVFLMSQRRFTSTIIWFTAALFVLTAYWGGYSDLSPMRWFVFSLMFCLFSAAGLMVIYNLEKADREQFLLHQHRDLSAITLQEFDTTERLCYLVALDAQLGIANRCSFDRALRQEWRRASRHKYPVAVVFLEFDSLETTQQMADVAQVASGFAQRSGDLVARYDANMVALLLIDTDHRQCDLLVRRLVDYLGKMNSKRRPQHWKKPQMHFASLIPGPALFPKDLIDKAFESTDCEAMAPNPLK